VNLRCAIGDPSFVISHAIIPKNLGVIKEMVFFWDFESHEYVDESWNYDRYIPYEEVKFKVLEPEEMQPDHDLLTDAYHDLCVYIGMALNSEKEPMRLREMYSQLDKRFCKQDGRWRSVAWSY
jgi:hypothetical protein